MTFTHSPKSRVGFPSLSFRHTRLSSLLGRFVPTRRTPAISTSDLLERIVRGYRDGFFDSKLEKNGLSELLASDVDWDSSPRSKQPKFLKSPAQ